jgi:hypothetical protein
MPKKGQVSDWSNQLASQLMRSQHLLLHRPAFSVVCHPFFQIPIAQRIPKIPTYTQQNNLGLEMTPFEQMQFCHDGSSGVLFFFL